MLQIVELLTCNLINCDGAGSDKTRFFSVRPRPPSKRNTGDEAGERREAERIDKVRSALGETYNMELHFAIAHMRRLDGAYPDLPNGVKAADFLKKDKGPRCVALV